MDFGAETQRLDEHITDEHHNTAVKTHRTFQYRLSHDVIEGLCLAMYKFIIIYNKIVVNSLSLHIPGVPYQRCSQQEELCIEGACASHVRCPIIL